MEQGQSARVDAEGSEVAATGGEARVSVPQILLLSAWFGLAAGLVELFLLAVRVELSEKGFFLRSKHFVWMVPVSDLAIYVTAGLFVCVLPLVGRRVPLRWLLGLLIFLACLSQLLLVRGLYSWASALFAAGVAVQTSRLVAARPTQLWSLVRRTRPILAVVLIVLFALPMVQTGYARFRRGGKTSAPVPGAPNVLLIVLDTVRADHLSLYGYPRDTSPNLARLAKEGVRFDLARAAAPWTLPSHASLFTGRWPHELGVEKLGWLDAAYPTLAEYLGARGYDTAGFVANTVLLRPRVGSFSWIRDIQRLSRDSPGGLAFLEPGLAGVADREPSSRRAVQLPRGRPSARSSSILSVKMPRGSTVNSSTGSGPAARHRSSLSSIFLMLTIPTSSPRARLSNPTALSYREASSSCCATGKN